MLLSGQPQTEVTTPPVELHAKPSTDGSGALTKEAWGTVASGVAVRKLLGMAYSANESHATVGSGAVVCKLLGTAYSAGAGVMEGLLEAVVAALGKVESSAAAVVVPKDCWHSRVRHRGGSGELHSATGLTANKTHHITIGLRLTDRAEVLRPT